MLNYNDIKPKKIIVHENEPWEVVEAQVSRKQANKPVNKTKLKNLISGNVVDYTFHVSDTVAEADIEKREIKYLYRKRDEIWFADPNNPKDRFVIEENVVGNALNYITPNTVVEAVVYNEDSIISLVVPIKVTLEVTEAPPNIKGNTASGSGKKVTVETGIQIQTPFFIEVGDSIIVNTDTASYVERAK